jgi:lysophospholipase L1-like esterase
LNRRMKLFALGFAVLLVLTASEAVIIATWANKTNQTNAVRVACVGDSITRGTLYTIDFWQSLGSNYVVGDFGVGGVTVSLTSDNPYMNQTAFQLAQQFEPNLVIVMLGTNDAYTGENESSTAFVNDYVKLLTTFQSLATKPEIWIVQPPPIYNNSAYLSPDFFAENIIPNIQQVASQMNLPLVDAYTPLLNHSEYFPDGVHPDNDGAQIIADAIYSAVNSSET